MYTHGARASPGGARSHEGEEAIGVRIVILAITIAVGLTGGASSGAAATSKPAGEDATVAVAAPESCPYAKAGLAYYRGRFIKHQLQRGAPVPTWRSPRNCADARYLVNVWAKRSNEARKKAQRHLERQRERSLRDFVVAPDSKAWHKAVREVQKAYPGTESWLMSCSASEGGWGRWVPNSQGSGVGGWLQFMPGTWSGFFNRALADVKSRGFLVPESAASWYSVLGQALAGAWGVTNGMRHHWAGSGC